MLAFVTSVVDELSTSVELLKPENTAVNDKSKSLVLLYDKGSVVELASFVTLIQKSVTDGLQIQSQ